MVNNRETFLSTGVRECVLIAAYDVGLFTSEGYVARSLLRRLDYAKRIILVTRRNNVAELSVSSEFRAFSPNVHLVGYDLPKWASWWKRGRRGYGLYAYLWQLSWPFVLKRRHSLIRRLSVVHTLNFHNDSIPNMGWILGRPSVWGPINHNEGVATWRAQGWPATLRLRNFLKIALRKFAWRFDPFLAMASQRTGVILTAGSWVERRLCIKGRPNVHRRSQLGLDLALLPPAPARARVAQGFSLVAGGRLDWIKGLDLAVAALPQLPEKAKLTIIGDGPCRQFLIELADRLGVTHRVSFQPAVPRDELLRTYAKHDIFLFPSAEAAGLAWVEALATGLPVVGFEGPTELFDMAPLLPGIHLVRTSTVREENVVQFAAAIISAANRNEDSETISAAARAHYDWDNFACELANIYKSVCEYH